MTTVPAIDQGERSDGNGQGERGEGKAQGERSDGKGSAAPFAGVCAVVAAGAGRFDGVIDPVWTIGPKVHGGTMQAGCAAAARAALRAEVPAAAAMQPLAISADFLGAPNPGAVRYRTNVRKTGRQICLVDVELTQDERTYVRASVTLGQLDDAPPVHQLPGLTDLPAEPPAGSGGHAAGSPLAAIVHLAQACDLCLDLDSAPFLSGGRGEPTIRLWTRPRPGDESDPDVAALFAVMATDISTPVVFNIGHIGWTPTVQMTTYLQRRPAPGWLRVLASAKSVGNGAFDEDHLVLDSTGAVVAQSRQLALIPRGT